MEDALATLVEVNSFTENVDGGAEVAARVLAMLRDAGLTADLVESRTYAPHVVARSDGNGRPPVALVGHLDTVFPPGTFEGFRRDGDLRRGPGVLDMKGGLVVVAFALRALRETVGLDRVPPLRVVVVSDEEVGSPEGQSVIRDAIVGSGACLVFESGREGDSIVTSRKGTGLVRVVATGRAAHAGNAHREGKNAIWAIARFVDRVQQLTDYARGVTINVGRISGGTSKNTVPDRAEAWVDLRFVTVADAHRLMEGVREAAEQAMREVEGTTLTLDGGLGRLPLERTDDNARLAARYGEHARAVGLGAGEEPLVGGGSDASTSAAMGIASIDGLGPRGKGFHTQDEQIDATSLVPKAQALVRFLADG